MKKEKMCSSKFVGIRLSTNSTFLHKFVPQVLDVLNIYNNKMLLNSLFTGQENVLSVV